MIWVGRVCSTNSYLNARDRHWANLSLAQHQEVIAEAKLEGSRVKYLFITALMNTPTIHYWVVPGDLIDLVAFAEHHDDQDFVYALHIREREGRYEIEHEDITSFHRVLKLSPAEVARLSAGFAAAKQASERRASRRSASTQPPDEIGAPRASDFRIPLRGGRSAVLSVPLPAAETDLARIKGWIDLMSDVLTEPKSAQTTPDRRESAMVALERLQRASAESGKDHLTSDDITAEIHSVRRERRR